MQRKCRLHIPDRRFKKAWNVLGLFSFIVLFTAAPCFAQSSDVMNRLRRIENELETLNRAVYRGEKPPPSAFAGDPGSRAGAEVRLQQLETELRALRGDIEQQNHRIRQMEQTLERALSDMELRLGELEQGGASGAAQGPRYTARPPQSAGQNATGDSEQTQGATLSQLGGGDQAAALYENAFALLKGGNYESAAEQFENFITRYPEHVLTSNAQYWLGETFYVRGQYQQAARIFAESYQQFPKGSKAPDNLLKLGMSLAAAGSQEDACVALGQIKKDFPEGPAPVLRRAEQEMNRLNCL